MNDTPWFIIAFVAVVLPIYVVIMVAAAAVIVRVTIDMWKR